jgi:acyl-CoA reductase-like NAD-dependent aldehyde dehydrogenase
MPDLTITIDGRSVSGVAAFGVINPASGKIFASAPDCTHEELDAAMESSARAFTTWRSDEAKRREALRACAEVLQARVSELAPILTREQGKPLAKATEEIVGAAVWFAQTASLELPVEVLTESGDSRIEVRRRPLGVVAAITPWNYPLLLAAWKIAPALLAGNTVVIKPSPFTPLSTLKLGALLREVLPPGVVNVVSGGDSLGAWMTGHPIPRKISFTGSVETGKTVAASAAPDLKRLTLELGGNDPAIVLPDVDPKEVANDLFWGAFANSGQICSAIKRLYVHESRCGALVSELAELARAVKMDDGFEPGVQLGPLNNLPQFERVIRLVEDAKGAGAEIAAGGKPRSGEGFFYEPTIVVGIGEGTRLVDEEQFGPALPVIPYREVDEALARANDTHFGLSGSVWSGDVDRATEVAAQLECGTAWVNQHLAVLPFTPFGGTKWSGIGVENGPWGLLGFTEIQTLNVKKR